MCNIMSVPFLVPGSRFRQGASLLVDLEELRKKQRQMTVTRGEENRGRCTTAGCRKLVGIADEKGMNKSVY